MPTCCSCQIDGYKESFPPLYKPDYSDEYKTPIIKTKYPTLQEEEDDENNEEDNDPTSYYSTAFKLQNQKPFNYDPSSSILLQSGSNKKNRYERPKSSKPTIAIASPGLESYLSPPSNDFETVVTFKRTPTTTDPISPATTSTTYKRKRRPIRRDQSSEGSEIKPQTMLPNNIEITTNRPFRITTTPKLEIRKVNAKLPNISTISSSSNSGSSQSGDLDLNKRINYNYHPIIDFFEEEDDEQIPDQDIDDRIGVRLADGKWRPMIRRRVRPISS